MDMKIVWKQDKAGILSLILSPYQEMLSARNLIDAHVQFSVACDGLLLPTPSELVQFTRHYTLLEMLDVFSLCVVAELSFLPLAV